MFKIRILIAVIVLPFLAKAQSQTYDITFNNGETKKIVLEYDDPDRLPRYNLGVSIFGFSVVPPEGMLTFKLKPAYRINKKMMVTGLLTSVYTRKMDPVIGDHLTESGVDRKKPTMGTSLLFHYSVFSMRKSVEKMQAVDYGMNTIYKAKIPRVVANTLLAEGGIYNMRTPNGVKLVSTDPTLRDTVFSSINTSSTSVGVGLCFSRHQSFKIVSDGIARSTFRYSRLYFHLTYALAQKYDVLAIDYGTSSDPVGFEPSTGYEAPEFSKLGWRLGWEKQLGFKNSSCSGTIGFEYAVIPSMSSAIVDGNYKASSPKEFFSIHFGIGIGAQPIVD